jgi:hypothetical protein
MHAVTYYAALFTTQTTVLQVPDPNLSRRQVLQQYGVYAAQQEAAAGEKWLNVRRRLLKPVWNIFHGEPGGKRFRQRIDSILTQVQQLLYNVFTSYSISNFSSACSYVCQARTV